MKVRRILLLLAVFVVLVGNVPATAWPAPGAPAADGGEAPEHSTASGTGAADDQPVVRSRSPRIAVVAGSHDRRSGDAGAPVLAITAAVPAVDGASPVSPVAAAADDRDAHLASAPCCGRGPPVR